MTDRTPLTESDMQRIIGETTALVSLPAVCVRINEIIQRNNYTAAEIGTLISQDANLATRLLRVANSAFYGFPSKIATISRAVTIVGSRELRDLVLATSAIEAFAGIPIEAANMNSFWMHSLDCAIIARLVATRSHMVHSESLFVSGLLHDVGHLVMYLKVPDLARDAMLLAARKAIDIEVAEREAVGFDHAQLGGALLQAWGLPDTLLEPVRFHHSPADAPHYQREATVVCLANILAKQNRIGGIGAAGLTLDERLIESLGLSRADIDPILQEAKQQFAEALAIFLPHLAHAN
jgi:HD-like signal output (HDOD) protein